MTVKIINRRDEKTDYKVHSHEMCEILYISDGEGKFKTSDGIFTVREGDIILVPPNFVHKGPGAEKCGVIYLIADLPVPQSIKKPFIVRDDGRRSVRTYFENVYDIYRLPDSEIAYKSVQASLCGLIFELVISLKLSADCDADVNLLRDAINRGFSDPYFRLCDTVESISPSPSYLRKRFKTAVGLSPVKYLNSLRMTEAKKLIANKKMTKMSFDTIAEKCGFSDERYFSRVFKAECGMTPGEYFKTAASY